MNFLFESSSWVLSSLCVVIPVMTLFCFLLWRVRNKISSETLKKNHDVAGFTFSIIGVLYSVILGFTVISEQDRYNKTVETIHSEASLIADLYRNAGFFPQPYSDQIQKNYREYVLYILEVEWGTLSGKKKRAESEKILEKIWNGYYAVPLNDDKTKIWYEKSVSCLNDLMDARLSREFSSWEHLGSMMWSLLIIGALITISFMLFFGLESIRTHMTMTALLAGYLSFMLYLVYSLDHVFKGPQAIRPVALEQVLTLFDQWEEDRLSPKQLM